MAAETLITPAMQQAVGRPMPAVTFDVERGAIVKFAKAIDDPNPLFNDDEMARQTHYRGIIAPPTFLRSLTPAILPLPDGERLSRVVDGGSTWHYFAPVCAGDRITVTARLESLSERSGRLGPMLLTFYLIEYQAQDGVLVATQRNTLIRY